MQVRVNGHDRELPEGLTVSGLLDADGEPAGHVLVEVNREYVSAAGYGRVLAAGDQIEIIHPAFGG